MGFSMEDRIKSGPLMPKWEKIKGRHKALNGKLFKANVAGPLGRYDQCLKDYEAETKNEATLKEDIGKLLQIRADAVKEVADLSKQVDQTVSDYVKEAQRYEDTVVRFTKDSGDSLSKVDAELRAWIDCADQLVDKRKALWDDIDGILHTALNQMKKAQKGIGDKSKAIFDRQYKIVTEAIGAKVEAEGIIRDYIDVAEEADHPEIVKDLQSLKF